MLPQTKFFEQFLLPNHKASPPAGQKKLCKHQTVQGESGREKVENFLGRNHWDLVHGWDPHGSEAEFNFISPPKKMHSALQSTPEQVRNSSCSAWPPLGALERWETLSFSAFSAPRMSSKKTACFQCGNRLENLIILKNQDENGKNPNINQVACVSVGSFDLLSCFGMAPEVIPKEGIPNLHHPSRAPSTGQGSAGAAKQPHHSLNCPNLHGEKKISQKIPGRAQGWAQSLMVRRRKWI